MSAERLWCKRCMTETEPVLTWQTFAGGTRHLRADCGVCGAYMQPRTAERYVAGGGGAGCVVNTVTQNRYRLEATRAWDFLDRLPEGHALLLPTLEKAYRLSALASGETEETAAAYARERTANWVALAAQTAGRG